MNKNHTEKTAGITLETSLVMPIFIFLLLNIISLFQMIQIHGVLDSALHQVGVELSLYADLGNAYEHPLLTEEYVRERVISIVGKNVIDRSVIVNGSKGITLWRTDMNKETKEIDMVMTYRTKPWFDVFDVGGMLLVNRCYTKAYTGYEMDDSEGGKYYLTDMGEVYHISRSCTHLELSISEITMEKAKQKTNLEGEAYTACEVCCDGQNEGDKVYITEQGSRYHSTVACTGLKRTIYIVSESSIAGLEMCSRCSKESR